MRGEGAGMTIIDCDFEPADALALREGAKRSAAQFPEPPDGCAYLVTANRVILLRISSYEISEPKAESDMLGERARRSAFSMPRVSISGIVL